MADAKSRFTRPEQPAAPSLSPQAEQFVHGPAATREGARAETATRSQDVHRDEKESPKQELMKRLTIDIPDSLHKRVKSQCGAQGTTIADVVRHFLERKFPEPKSQ